LFTPFTLVIELRGIIAEKLTDEEKKYYLLVRKAFDILAPYYDTVAALFSSVRGRMVDFIKAQRGSKILDVATGTEQQAFAFARKGYEVIGIDISDLKSLMQQIYHLRTIVLMYLLYRLLYTICL
jgi:ubiquinone/menaquinone biosynthesis C-methylase UbiE